MKRFIGFIGCLVLTMGMLSGCASSPVTDMIGDVMADQGMDVSALQGEAPEQAETAPAEITAIEITGTPEEVVEEEPVEEEPAEDEKITVDLILFMGQSNMAGAGGNAAYAPSVPEEAGYEFRAISDPTRLYPITEPFGVNENNLNAILDLPGAKNGSLVSAFVNKYYALTSVPVVAVSASAGATDTDFWMSEPVQADFTERLKRAVVWLENDKYVIRHKYVIWLQGESDALDHTSSEEYQQNMDAIIRPLFINGIEKVFFITPGRTVSRKEYFNEVIAAQKKMGTTSPYYAVASTMLSVISTEYMVDEWHYNQKVLNLLGEDAATSVAYFANNGTECAIYDYKEGITLIPEGDGVSADTKVEPIDLSGYDFTIE